MGVLSRLHRSTVLLSRTIAGEKKRAWAEAHRTLPTYAGRPPIMFVLTQSIYLSNYLLANFRGLVLGCIEAKLLNQIFVGKI